MPTNVHNPTVDVAKLLEAEQPRAVGRVIEGEALGKSALKSANALRRVDRPWWHR
jgi:hypothetical protein